MDDDGNTVNTDSCTTTCKSPVCGDGFTQAGAGEECDDANGVNTDACTNGCKLARCGDKIVQAGEECDDGNAVATDACALTACPRRSLPASHPAGERSGANGISADGTVIVGYTTSSTTQDMRAVRWQTSTVAQQDIPMGTLT